ncbi:fibrous sheath-interacting protein 1 isoform X2 [Channa argus]|uniref:fibrous sheath-interacting protein 1 isoform X2 n=1 Tax=Channa argus TaxID=215402 RepID=UPI00351FFB00
MEIIRGNLDDISRPASSEQTGSRVSSVSMPHSDRICPTPPFALVVLTNDAADIQIQSCSEEAVDKSSTKGPDREKEDSKLRGAYEEMRRLDKMLSAKISKEKQVKRQRRELHAKLWQDLMQNKPKGYSECAHEVVNTRLFLALEAPDGTEDEKTSVSVFETQIPDCDSEAQPFKQSEKRPDNLTKSFELGYEKTGEEQFESSHCGSSKGKKKDFVKRNIEAVGGEEGQVLLTQSEKKRLAELLREIEEEEEDCARGGDSEEDMWAVSVLTGQVYTPEPSDLEQLIDIDSKMRLFLPTKEFLSTQSSYTDFALTRDYGSDVAWKCDGDAQPGEKVLQDIKERRVQEKRLQEIQQQLEILGQGQDMSDLSPDLTEEQLLSLLDECELTESWNKDIEPNDTTP